MEKNITLSEKDIAVRKSVSGITENAKMPFILLGKYYSSVLETKITFKQTLILLNAQVSFLFFAFPVQCSLPARAICFIWFAWAMVKCRSIRTSD